MKKSTSSLLGITLAGVLALIVTPAHADTFGSGANTFSIPFVPIGNAGNANDTVTTQGGPGLFFGGVSYNYNMSTYAISQTDINAATALGVAGLGGGAWTGSQPAGGMNWYQDAAFVNWLNTSHGYAPAYNLTYSAGSYSMALWSPAQAWQLGGQDLYRSANCEYFLPSDNEYYKAAYYDPNYGGVGVGGYWQYATGSNAAPTAVASGTTPGTAVYNGVASQPAAVNSAGGLSPYGTMGQDGNVDEWMETSYADDNSSPSEDRANRGDNWTASALYLESSSRGSIAVTYSGEEFGFRVASLPVPEPSTTVLMIGSGLMFLARRRRAAV